MSPRGYICACHAATYMCAYVCARVGACVRVSVIRGLSILIRIYTTPLNTLHLYTARITFIFSCGTIFLFIFTQVTWRDGKLPIHAFNRSHRSSLKVEGYVATSYWATIHFKMI